MSRYPNDANQAGSYTGGAGNANEYAFHPGVCVLPVAEDPPEDPAELAAWSPVVALRLHAPYRTRLFKQTAVKEGNPAAVAAPGDTGAFVFLGGSMAVASKLSTALRTYDWSSEAAYHYVEACASRDASGNELGLVLGTLPYKEVVNRENEVYGYTPPPLGAVARAGRAATVGYNMGLQLVAGQDGQLRETWVFNNQAFFPAELFYSDLANAGKPVVQGG